MTDVAHHVQVMGDEDEGDAQLSRSSSNRLMICAWIEASSAETGSSAMISCGRTASARAMLTRWRWPPLKAWGRRSFSRAASPTVASSSSTRRWRSAPSPSPWTRRTSSRAWRDRHARIERGVGILEDHLDLAAQGLASAEAGQRAALPEYLAAGSARAARRCSVASVLLPQPLSPTTPRVSPGARRKETSRTAWSARAGWPQHHIAERRAAGEASSTSSRTSSRSGVAVMAAPGPIRRAAGRPLRWPARPAPAAAIVHGRSRST